MSAGAIVPAALLALVWLMLTENQPSSWLIGVPFIGLALLVVPRPDSNRIAAPRLLSLNLLRFSRFFITESIRGGIDVSRRVLARKPAINPCFYSYAIRLKDVAARHVFFSSISLLPGTLCADWTDGTAHIHALDDKKLSIDSIRTLEQHVADLFGERL